MLHIQMCLDISQHISPRKKKQTWILHGLLLETWVDFNQPELIAVGLTLVATALFLGMGLLLLDDQDEAEAPRSEA